MYKIYLDWNVFKMLKKSAKDNKSDALKNLFNKYGSDFLIPYSPAHIQDLLKGSDDPKNKPLIEDDLNFIDELTLSLIHI